MVPRYCAERSHSARDAYLSGGYVKQSMLRDILQEWPLLQQQPLRAKYLGV